MERKLLFHSFGRGVLYLFLRVDLSFPSQDTSIQIPNLEIQLDYLGDNQKSAVVQNHRGESSAS